MRKLAFALLVAASVGAFFVAQRIKNSPSVIQDVKHPLNISPNGDGHLDVMRVNLRLKKADRVTLTIVDSDGDPVKTILSDRRLEAYKSLRQGEASWDGRDSQGRLVADGLYRLRITLRELGRTATDTKSIIKDTVPPKPTILRVDPAGTDPTHPTILPRANGGDVTAIFKKARDQASISVFQTSPRIRRVLTANINEGIQQWSWDGKVDGARVPPGTYVFVARWRDQAGNLGSSVPLDRRGLPVLGKPFPGRGGVTVRYLSVAPPAQAITAGRQATFAIDSRGERYRWSLRRAGGRTIKSGRANRPLLTLKIPRANAGLYVLEARTSSHSARAPFVVNGTRRNGGTAEAPRGVLVVAPTLSWQGRNPVDDDGDGAPNLLDFGGPAIATRDGRLRPFAGDGLPIGLNDNEVPLFRWLDASHSYDVATDLQLQSDPRLLRGYRGVILASAARWLTPEQRGRLRRFVEGGGKLLSLGTGALRRTVQLDRDRLTRPSAPAATDLFGARIGSVRATPTGIEVFEADQIGLFTRGGGAIGGVIDWEPTAGVGTRAEQLSSAVTADTDPPGQIVSIAVRYGEGVVIRPGFGTFAARLQEPAVSLVMDGAWAQLSR
ncbi:MAG TPA: N,N-dimethylformamidase beta subunit family domain-containing protein [Baekduia sp.]|nr:N,N-dimethylformamidase beta subunit family domain-containing protein [Baekduia sp.]